MCYKDITFCPFNKCKDWTNCSAALTDKVKEDAEKWMKNAPICHYIDKPDCYEE